MSAKVFDSCHRSGASLIRLFLSIICNSPFAVYLRPDMNVVLARKTDLHSQSGVLGLKFFVDVVVRGTEGIDVWLVYGWTG